MALHCVLVTLALGSGTILNPDYNTILSALDAFHTIYCLDLTYMMFRRRTMNAKVFFFVKAYFFLISASMCIYGKARKIIC